MIHFKPYANKAVSLAALTHVAEAIGTPFKVGAVNKSENAYTDSPTVVYDGNRFYMYYISIAKDVENSGYETHVSVSDDLLHWEYKNTILRRKDDNSWDSLQRAGYAAFVDPVFGHSPVQETIDGQLYLAALGGNGNGYEPDPLCMGLVCHSDYTDIAEPVQNEPILTPNDSDVRPFEDLTLYKSCMQRDAIGKSGFRYINCYNAKGHDCKERIYLAVSDDGISWQRYGERAVIDNTLFSGNIISGDPQIIIIDGMYVMLYFRFDLGRGAYNTFACSYDLVHWTDWGRTPLIYPEYDFENVHAHKPFLFMHDGIVYHFYCACNKQKERFIALATSERLV